MASKLTEQQFKDITFYRYGLGPRPKNVPSITTKNYGYVLIRWKRFDDWNRWQDKGKPDPRPANVWVRVPQWETHFNPWDLRKAILKKRKPYPPPPDVPVPPNPPVPAHAAQFQRVAYMGGDPLSAMQWHGCKIAFTADPNPAYDQYVTAANAAQARANGHDVYVWYVPTQVSKARAYEVAAELGTTVVIGQAETLPEFWTSWENGHRVVIGNLGACWPDDQARLLIQTGQMVFCNEFYWNANRNLTPNNYNAPVVSMCVALYDGGPNGEGQPNGFDPTMNDYWNAGFIWPGMSVYGPGTTDADWQTLNNHGI